MEAGKEVALRDDNALTPQNIEQVLGLAKVLARSTLIPKEFVGKEGDVAAAIMLGLDLGLKPMQALTSICVINGKPSIWGDGAKAVVISKPECEIFDEDSAEVALKNGAGRCRIKRRGHEKAHEVKFTTEMAKAAGLLSKPGPWQQYPGRMMQMRARAWAMRDTFPDALKGIQIREEVEDYPIVITDDGGSMQPTRKSDAGKEKPEAVDAEFSTAPTTTENLPGPSAAKAESKPETKDEYPNIKAERVGILEVGEEKKAKTGGGFRVIKVVRNNVPTEAWVFSGSAIAAIQEAASAGLPVDAKFEAKTKKEKDKQTGQDVERTYLRILEAVAVQPETEGEPFEPEAVA